jgi:hypothetical protein
VECMTIPVGCTCEVACYRSLFSQREKMPRAVECLAMLIPYTDP